MNIWSWLRLQWCQCSDLLEMNRLSPHLHSWNCVTGWVHIWTHLYTQDSFPNQEAITTWKDQKFALVLPLRRFYSVHNPNLKCSYFHNLVNSDYVRLFMRFANIGLRFNSPSKFVGLKFWTRMLTFLCLFLLPFQHWSHILQCFFLVCAN